ncbi:FecR family protein [Flavitalea flava]
MPEQDITELFNRFFQGTITQEEKEVLTEWIQRSPDNEELFSLMRNSWQNFETRQSLPSDKAKKLLATILQKGKKEESKENKAEPVPALLVPIWSRKWYRIAAAVMIIGVVGAAGYIFQHRHGLSGTGQLQPSFAKKDVTPPSSVNAVLTLANGRKIILDSVANGTLAMQGGTGILKTEEGRIIYQGRETTVELQYNTLTVPRGSRIASITLSDGSKVWLNAGSSMTYPVAFSGSERKISITGEGYFEVAQNPSAPFIVSNGDKEIKVLGTHFNVNAYEEESDMKVTLLEGSVKITAGAGNILLKPGQMAKVDQGLKIKMVRNANLPQVMAWKNGLFDFEGADIRTVMRELSRWYGVQVEYKDEITEKFYIETNRNANVTEVFKILETTGGVHFKVEVGKIIVMR